MVDNEVREPLLRSEGTEVAEENSIENLCRCEEFLNTRYFHFRQQVEELLGPEPPYLIQEENTASAFLGGLYYTWVGDFMHRAAREELREHNMPRPTRRTRAYNVGRELLSTLHQQKFRRHGWDSYIGVKVSHKDDALSIGVLRWVGYVQQFRTPGQLYAGVEWQIPPAHRVKQFETNDMVQKRAAENSRKGNKSSTPGVNVAADTQGREEEEKTFVTLFHSGVVDGEHLFSTSDGAPTATCEPVEEVIIVSPIQWQSPGRGREVLSVSGLSMPITSQKPPKCISVAWALLRTFRKELCMIIPLRLLRDVCQLASPVVLRKYIEYLQTENPTWEVGVQLVAAFCIVSLMQSVASNKLSHIGWRGGCMFQNALLSVLFIKCATVARRVLAHPDMSVGRIVNMVSSDVGNAKSFPQILPVAIGAPLQLLVGLFLMYRSVGWSAFVGFGVLVLFLPLQGVLMGRYFRNLSALARARDERLKASNEFFSGIRLVKFMTLEPSIIFAIEKKRKTELLLLRSIQWLYIGVAFLANAVPPLAASSIFMVYHMSGGQLTPIVIFPTLALFQLMEIPFIMIPVSISSLMRFVVSMRRVSDFLECDDMETGLTKMASRRGGGSAVVEKDGKTGVDDRYDENEAVAEFRHAMISTYVPCRLPLSASELKEARKIAEQTVRGIVDTHSIDLVSETERLLQEVENNIGENTMGSSGTDGPGSRRVYYELRRKDLLRDVTLRIPKGKFTCVIGETGCGKTTLLESLIEGCYEVTGGSVRMPSSIAYVPQQPWIMNASIKANVLFFSDTDEVHFRRVLRCTQLEQDLLLLPDGVETEIGEKGVNLSGGQKARVSLARAVYAKRDVYILDDPLSALDAHVGERVLHECLLGELNGTTRVLATHQMHVLQHADFIVLLGESGVVKFSGSYKEYQMYMASTEGGSLGHVSEPVKEFEGSHAAGDCALQYEGAAAVDAVLGVQKGGRSGSDVVAEQEVEDGAATRCSDDDSEELRKAATRGQFMTKEEMKSGTVAMETYIQYAEACGGRLVCLLIFLAYAFTEIVLVSPLVWLSFWSVSKFNLNTNTYLIVYVCLTTASALCSPLRLFSGYGVLRAGSSRLHSRLLRSVAAAPMSFFDTTPLGRIINRFSKDIVSIDEDLPDSLLYLLQCMLSVVSSLFVMAASQYIVLLAIIPCGFIYYRLMVFYNSASREMRRVSNRANSPVFSVLGEMLAGRNCMDAFGRTSSFISEAFRRIDTVYACSYMKFVSNCWLSVRIECLVTILLTTISSVGVLFLLYPQLGKVDVGLLSLSITLAVNISSGLMYVVNNAADVEANMNSVERVLHYTYNIDHEDVIEDIEQVLREQEEREELAAKHNQSHGRGGGKKRSQNTAFDVEGDAGREREEATVEVRVFERMGPPNEAPGTDTANTESRYLNSAADPDIAVEFRDVTMRYGPSQPLVLRGLTFKVVAGQKVGIVGRTGSGKSSLLLTLLRMVEVENGEVLVSGRPIRSYRLRELRQRFSIIPQDPLLLEGTLRDNLDPSHSSSDSEIHEALQLVGMRDRISAEPDGLHCRVVEGGTNFSVGQRQLLCMARALLRRSCTFILMDEATANVDPTLDRQLQHTIRYSFASYTVITVAHRLHTLAGYDSIILLGEGRVLETGRPQDLVRRKDSQFARMVASQGKGALKKFMSVVV
ncbi:putative ABC transporter transmembrane region ABC transporter [Trypanosoma vivax]|uniref:Putative multidrug resistance protein E n=1 Tax=Trypanosoma vivax (strain Y486) TaxID=1055687 RepID=G0TUU4_TRYVY|nr:putative multidrug resistance protein E [Trypanosoma vivax]KAH8611066.1 putative ABC transporter transmembrane region ABC transporter [Trypanosoma vivax]CCC47731.1 putative multidrug resistance protein E [Trypanosoma vivax Y486]